MMIDKIARELEQLEATKEETRNQLLSHISNFLDSTFPLFFNFLEILDKSKIHNINIKITWITIDSSNSSFNLIEEYLRVRHMKVGIVGDDLYESIAIVHEPVRRRPRIEYGKLERDYTIIFVPCAVYSGQYDRQYKCLLETSIDKDNLRLSNEFLSYITITLMIIENYYKLTRAIRASININVDNMLALIDTLQHRMCRQLTRLSVFAEEIRDDLSRD